MLLSITRALSFCGAISLALASAQSSTQTTLRMLDLNGDEELDLFEGLSDGTLVVSLGSGHRQFEQLHQDLPSAVVTELVAGDLNDDGFIDLYLVTPHANVALVGDGAGLFADVTLELGLRDEGVGQSAMLRDLDADGRADLFLFNQTGDVLFWGVPGGFERDARTPFVPVTVEATRIIGEAILPTPGLGRRDPKSVAGSTLNVLNNLNGEHSAGRRPIAIDPTTPQLPEPGGTVSPTPEQPLTFPGLHLLPIESPRGLPKLHVGLTNQEKQVLSLLSVVDLPDGLGGVVQTLRVSGANLQVVNGLGLTDSLNGLGNLIVGYNELIGVGDNRTGSHNIVGGNQNNYTDTGGHIVGVLNAVSSKWASVSGGQGNTASGFASSISGGNSNSASGFRTSVSGGQRNTASGFYSSVSGGSYNIASFNGCSVSGGRNNGASGIGSSVSGGGFNTASGTESSISGGYFQNASGELSSISGGRSNVASANHSTVSGGYLNIASGSSSSVSGGRANTASGISSSIGGGSDNRTYSFASSISGGASNRALADNSSVSGGRLNTASGYWASVSGGDGNAASDLFSSVSGGQSNVASATYASVSGGLGNTASYSLSSISGGLVNQATNRGSSVSGGIFNTASGYGSSISGGNSNTASGFRTSISGGQYNLASTFASSVSGGEGNRALGTNSSVSGGFHNTALGSNSSVIGGAFNYGYGTTSSISGGRANTASGISSSVSGGLSRIASGTYNWRAGTYFSVN